MEPKNPIIIDGVDVSKCKYRSSTPSSELCYNRGNKCNENSNCMFKQLARKEQECERLKNELSTYGATGICEVCTEKSVLQNDRYIKALIVIENIAKEDFNHTCWETYARQLKQILQKISEVNK